MTEFCKARTRKQPTPLFDKRVRNISDVERGWTATSITLVLQLLYAIR